MADRSETVPLSSVPMLASDTRLWLLFHGPGIATSCVLHPGESTIAGRARPDAETVLDDPSVSRAHARLDFLEDGSLQVSDLGSTNGTCINGETLQKATIYRPGDALTIGAIRVRVQVLEPDDQGLVQHETFISRLEEEVERARECRRPLAVLLVRAPGHVEQVVRSILPSLRSVDRAARYSDDIVEVLLPEMGPVEVEKWAEGLRAESRAPIAVSVTTFPAGGRSAGELLGRAHDALGVEPGLRSGDRGAASDADPSAPVIADRVMRELYDYVAVIAEGPSPVLVRGETGSGKELIAREVHERSGRTGKLVCVNCGAIPRDLIASSLFGAERGAYTGADKRRVGFFEAADGGTIFLDEIGELPAEAQAALLRVLDSGRLIRVGGTDEVGVDVRVVAATHRNLEAMTDAQTFRQDLYYRLGEIIDVPPLRDRPGDVIALAERFLSELGHAAPAGEVNDALLAYTWPGNVRELRNVIQRAVNLARGGPVTAAHFPSDAPRGPSAPSQAVVVVGEDRDLKAMVRDYERQVILAVLEACDGNQTEAARQMQTPLRTIVDKMKKLGIKRKASGYE